MSHPNRTCEFHFPGVARRRIGISHHPDLHFVRVPATARRRVYLARNVVVGAQELEPRTFGTHCVQTCDRFVADRAIHSPTACSSSGQQLLLTYSKPTNDSQSPSAGEDAGVDQATGVRLNKPYKAADPRQGSQIRDRRGAAITARKRALAEWDKANPDAVYDPELFRRDILPRLGTVPLAEIMEAAGCSTASASDYRRGKWTPHVSTWGALGELVGIGVNATAPLTRPVR